MTELAQLVRDIVEDGVVDADEALRFEAVVFADGTIDREEADAAFEINDAVSGNDNSPEWTRVFVRTLASYVLEDETTPGVIDEEEGNYLLTRIGADGNYDEVERALIGHLSAHAVSYHSSIGILVNAL